MFKHLVVKDCMSKKIISFTPGQPIIDAVRIMLEHNIGGAPVLNENKIMVGIISAKDCLNAVISDEYYDQHIGIVAKYMNTNIKTVHEDDSVLDLALDFTHTQYHRFPVLNDVGTLVGVVSQRDILSAMKRMFDEDHHSRTTGHRG